MAPLLLEKPSELRRLLDAERAAGRTVAFVPTMGALHEGHLSLARHGRAACDVVVVSIFVNPRQFGPAEDIDRYPRDLAGDMGKLAGIPVDVVFAPPVEAMYPPGFSTTVRVAGLGDGLCGASRPGHFDGVATVVAKLFSMVGPCTAVFGRKDYQQIRVIERMTADLGLPIEIVGLPTVREPDGLAMSSRNAYLAPDERSRAGALVDGLRAAAAAFAGGTRDADAVGRLVRERLDGRVDRVDYVFVGDPITLRTWEGTIPDDGGVLVAIAAWVGSTRLIDNAELGVDILPPAS